MIHTLAASLMAAHAFPSIPSIIMLPSQPIIICKEEEQQQRFALPMASFNLTSPATFRLRYKVGLVLLQGTIKMGSGNEHQSLVKEAAADWLSYPKKDKLLHVEGLENIN